MNAVRQRLSDNDIIKTRESHMQRLTELFGGIQDRNDVFVLNGISSNFDCAFESESKAFAAAQAQFLADHAEDALNKRVFRPLVFESWLYGVHFADAVLGGDVKRELTSTKDGTASWWCNGVDNPLGTLKSPSLESNIIWQKASEFADEFVKLNVSAPFITTQVLSSAINIIFNLYKEKFLLALHLDPADVRRDLKIIADTMQEMHLWFSKRIPKKQFSPIVASGRIQPRGMGQLCGCATQLLSPESYKDFFATLDDKILQLYPGGGMIHLCGSHRQHIPVWREMELLRAVQLNDRAADDYELYFNGLRDDQIIYLFPTAYMTIERALEISKGKRLVLVTQIEEPPIVTKLH